MPSPFTRVVWNKFEAVLLVDAYMRVSRDEIVRNEAVSQLSKRLRNRMIINGIDINDRYRNENGINLQMATMEYIMTNGDRGISTPNKLLDDIVNLYFGQHEEYLRLLDEALKLYPEPVKKISYNVVDSVEVDSVMENDVANTILLSRIKSVLSAKFPKGMRLNSAIDNRRFRSYYSDMTGMSCDLSEDELISALKRCGIESGGKVYVAEQMLPTELRDAVSEYVDSNFASGRNYIFYECIFQHFKEPLLDTLVANSKLLCTYLKCCYEDRLFFGSDYMASDSSVKVDVDKIVIDYVHEQWQLMTEDEVVEALPYLPESAVRNAFNRNQSVLVGAGGGRRFHIDKFEISQDNLDNLSHTIETVIQKSQFMGADELLEYIHQSLPSVISDNSEISELGIRKALAIKLDDKFAFNNAVISHKGMKLSAREALLAFAKSHRNYTLAEVDGLAQSLGTVLNYHLEALLEYSWRVDDNNFVAKDLVHIDVDAADKAVGSLLDNTTLCCPLRGVANMVAFPVCGYPWTQRLLESYLLTTSHKYQLYKSDYLNKNNICGVVSLRDNSTDFKSLMVRILSKSRVKLDKAEILDFMASEGYIVQRRYSEIDSVIKAAKILKNKNN